MKINNIIICKCVRPWFRVVPFVAPRTVLLSWSRNNTLTALKVSCDYLHCNFAPKQAAENSRGIEQTRTGSRTILAGFRKTLRVSFSYSRKCKC